MQYSPLLLATLASLVSAQNPFSFVTLPQSIKVGDLFNITWSPSTGTTDTVTLLLRQGDPNRLVVANTIAASIQNSGFYLWTPTSAITNGDKYAIQIVDDANTALVNYSGQFAIDSPNTVSSPLPLPTTPVSVSGSSITSATPPTSAMSTAININSKTGSDASTNTNSSKASSKTTSSSGASTAVGAPSASGNAAVGMHVSGGLLVLAGAVMAAV